MYLSPENTVSPIPSVTVKPRVESLLEKGSGELNEDMTLVGRSTFAVFDGATSIVSKRFDGNCTGGRLAAEICRDHFSDEEICLTERALRANQAIRKKALAHGVSFRCKEELWSVSAAAIELNGDTFNWCRIGDCQILILYHDNRIKLLGEDHNHDLQTLRGWQQAVKQQGSASVMEVMATEILRVRRRMNIDYGVLNGEAEALDFLQSGREPLAAVRSILLYSDGLMLPRQDPAAPQDIEMMSGLYRRGGLQAIRQYVRTLQLADISCRQYPRFKTHDDISAVAVSL